MYMNVEAALQCKCAQTNFVLTCRYILCIRAKITLLNMSTGIVPKRPDEYLTVSKPLTSQRGQ